ncbi:MAG: hypothetical protein JW720_14985 [Sedimentisphaerales bacterium]|nr:hypothetical protein [Sedimentisphaerales bacterium]
MKKLIVLVLTIGLLSTAAPAAITGSLSPDSIFGVHNLGETKSYTLDYSVDITDTGAGTTEVLFLTDTTGSMYSYISGIQTAFNNIQSRIASDVGAGVSYAVADYKDYYDGGAYSAYGINLRQAFTTSSSAVQTAINGMSAGGGYDTPEEQMKSLTQVANYWTDSTTAGLDFGGTSAAQKIIIWAGDAVGHAGPSDYESYDMAGSTGWYPSLANTISALNSRGILTFALNTTTAGYGIDGVRSVDESRNQASAITAAGGGTLFNSVGSGSTSIEDTIVAAITGGVETLTNITVAIEAPGADAPFTWSPASQTRTGTWHEEDSPVTGSFTFSATAPIVNGTATFDMVLYGNGGELDRTTVTLTTIPAPGAILLGSLGAGLVGWLRRRKSL